MKYKPNKGSIWKKWDLHIHTPLTKLNNQYEINIEDYCKTLEESDTQVFGITDYFNIETYKIFTKEYSQRYPKTTKVFFPNIEFRLYNLNQNSEHIQVHVIFNNDSKTLSQIDDFLEHLEIKNIDFSSSTTQYCKYSTIEKIGYDKIIITAENLIKTLESNVERENYLIIGVVNGYGSFRPKANDGRYVELVKNIDNKCDGFFGKPDNVDFYLNKKGERPADLRPKPVFGGSDAHKEADINRTEIIPTWIKADTTFQGLWQTTFEPEERIRLGVTIPDRKDNQFIIERVSFNDPNFTTKDILLNPNLNTIIGGKSTGKSSLLKSIALTIKGANSNIIKNNSIPLNNFKVSWCDGKISELNSDTNPPKDVIYIEQSKLNKLAENTEELQNTIQNTLSENSEIYQLFDTYEKQNQLNKIEILKSIDILFNLILTGQDIQNKTIQIGDSESIDKEIENIQNEISALTVQGGMTNLEIETYYSLTEKERNLVNQLKELEKTKSNFEKLSRESCLVISETYLSILESINGEYNSEIKTILQDNIEITTIKINTYINNNISNFDQKILNIISELKTINEQLSPLIEKTQIGQIIYKKKDLLKEYIDKKNLITKHFQEASENAIKILNCKQKLKILVVNYESNINDFIVKVSSICNTELSSDFNFIVDKLFRRDDFYNNFVSKVFNITLINRFESGLLSYVTDNDNLVIGSKINSFSDYLSNIILIIDGIINDNLTLKKGIDKKIAVTTLLNNWLSFSLNLSDGTEKLDTMSPGKRSLMLLKLILEVDKSKCPLLIDQPEDDLDNRSIYRELVSFVKQKKRERQIIIVTHNPNLVVSADSECVIVANQNSISTPNIGSIKFDYVQGPIESSFISDDRSTLHSKGIQEHVCDILEGGLDAFQHRKNKYRF
ncbi:hypothetical protein [Microcystis phage Mwe-JY31]